MRICLLTSKLLSKGVGGKQALIARVLDVLATKHEVTLVTFDRRLDFATLDSLYGTSLCTRTFSVRNIFPWIFLAHKRFWLLRNHILSRFAKQNAGRFDVFFCASGEMDIVKQNKGIQLIYLPTPTLFERQGHSVLGRRYRSFCFWLSGMSLAGMKNNRTLCISEWVADRVQETYGLTSTVLYPPIELLGERGMYKNEWNARKDGFVAVSRFSREKRIEDIITIVEKAREVEPLLHLHLIGDPQDPAYVKEIQELARERDWVHIESTVSRTELLRLLATHKYGIHAMHNEHFGIVVGEMVCAGMIPFVHRSGGPAEIVDGDERVTFSSVPDAVSKIRALIKNSNMQKEIRHTLRQCESLFSIETFSKKILEVVEQSKFVL